MTFLQPQPFLTSAPGHVNTIFFELFPRLLTPVRAVANSNIEMQRRGGMVKANANLSSHGVILIKAKETTLRQRKTAGKLPLICRRLRTKVGFSLLNDKENIPGPFAELSSIHIF